MPGYSFLKYVAQNKKVKQKWLWWDLEKQFKNFKNHQKDLGTVVHAIIPVNWGLGNWGMRITGFEVNLATEWDLFKILIIKYHSNKKSKKLKKKEWCNVASWEKKMDIKKLLRSKQSMSFS